MSDPVHFEPKRLSFRYSAGKSEEDLIKEDSVNNKEEENVEKHGELNKNTDNIFYNETFEEKSVCDYLVNICRCASWLCANLVSSTVLCFENIIDFIQTCKCNREFCCDICGGSDYSVTESRSSIKNSRLRDISEINDGGQELSNIVSLNDSQDNKDKEKPDNSSIDEKNSSAEQTTENIPQTP
ncbi:hypothetical protein KGM_204863 [Danaus plexippus plexippus]|uniref:Uncharacterized protein n=1 Tax=Danaus plexippus plexippus TaxID=278856 RepID=A0A212FQ36_DANPL|nr:hypothetical protein KGM_204863 [Danaus plexippus plexippus]